MSTRDMKMRSLVNNSFFPERGLSSMYPTAPDESDIQNDTSSHGKSKNTSVYKLVRTSINTTNA